MSDKRRIFMNHTYDTLAQALQKYEESSHDFVMPECKFCATCGTCIYYEMYGFGKAYCNLHQRDVSSSNAACGSYS